MLFCAMLLGGCAAPKKVDTKAEGESTAVPQKVIALSKSNAELWLLAGGSLIGTSEDAMALAGISPETYGIWSGCKNRNVQNISSTCGSSSFRPVRVYH